MNQRQEALRRIASRSSGTLRQVIVNRMAREAVAGGQQLMTDEYGRPKGSPGAGSGIPLSNRLKSDIPLMIARGLNPGLSGLGASFIKKAAAKFKAKKVAKKAAKVAKKAAQVSAHAAAQDVLPVTTVAPAAVPAVSIPATSVAVATSVAATIMDQHPEYAPEEVTQAVARAMPEEALSEEAYTGEQQYETPDVYSEAWRGGQEEVPMPAPEEQGEQDVTQELLDRGWVGQPTTDGVAYERGQPTYADGAPSEGGDLETMLKLADQEIEGAELRQGDIPEGEEYAMFNGLPELLQNPLVLGALALGALLLFRKKIR